MCEENRPTSNTFLSIYGNYWIIYSPPPLCEWEGERFADLTSSTTMLCPAPAAVWLLLVLSPGLSLSAEDASGSGFSLCRDCFYRQMPPQAAPAGPPLLQPLCHRLPGGRAFATASKPTCDTTVYSAFHLGHEWAEREGEEEGELVVSWNYSIPSYLKCRNNVISRLFPQQQCYCL